MLAVAVELWSLKEIGRYLSVSAERARQVAADDPTFPRRPPGSPAGPHVACDTPYRSQTASAIARRDPSTPRTPKALIHRTQSLRAA